MSHLIDLTGRKFGRWTVLELAARSVAGQTRWRCRCDCGNEGIVQATSLKRIDGAGSCGCWRRDNVIARSTKHGFATGGISPTYHTWAGMKARCTNPKHKNYVLYGGRGITVCERWLSFEAFLADMGEKPANRSLDRIDNDGPYSPENCRWVTQKEQMRNARINRRLTLDGVTKTIAEWSELFSIPYATITDRLYRGLSDSEALAKVKKR